MRPVTPIPTDRIAAPRRYERDWVAPAASAEGCASVWSAEAAKHHRPRERRADLLDCPVAREHRDEAPLRPVVDVAWRVAEVLQVGAARHVQPAPQRLAR